MTGYFYSIGQPRFGIVAGGLLSKTSGATSTFRPGGYAGLETDLKLGKLVSVRPQLKYMMKGETIDPEGKGSYNYLELPINFVYYIPTNAGRFSVGGGPAVSYMMSGSWTLLDGTKEPIDFDFDKVNHFDFGVNAIVNFELKKRIFFSVNYTLGLVDVWAADYVGKNKNRTIGLGAGFMF